MAIQKGSTVPITHMEGIPSAGVSPNNGMMASSPPVHMNMYMHMNESLLHDPHHAAHPSAHRLSPRDAGLHGAHQPPPPVLTLPTAMHAPVAGAFMPAPPHGHVPLRVHTAYEAASMGPDVHQSAPILPDPKELDDSALKDAYFKFLLEMETRGLHSMSLNSAPAERAPAPSVANVSISSSSSCLGGASGPAAVPVLTSNSARSPSPSMAISPGGVHFLSAQVAEFERMSSAGSANSAHTPRAPTSAGIAAKTTPSTAHSAVPSTTNTASAVSSGSSGNNTPSAADIRKNVKRSKSGGSEASFYPTSLFPGGAPVPAVNTSVPPAGSSGRRTPSSPMLRAHQHGGISASASGAHGESFYEPEDLELKNAFGHSRYPGSPSNLQYSGQSPSYLSSNATAPTYYAQHNSLTQSNAHSSAFGGNHSHGTTPTSVTAASTTWTGPAGSHPTTSGTSISSNGAVHAHNSRSASRCSGVAPPMSYDARDELLDLRPAVRNNCLSTLPPTYSYISNGAVTSAPQATLGADVPPTNRVDLKTPKFVRTLREGMGSALRGLTGSANREDDSSQGEGSVASKRAHEHDQGQGHESPAKVATSAHHAKDSRAPQSPYYADTDNSIDAVMAAGGLDQLLTHGRAKHRGSSLIPDDHSAFSHGSMSLSSVRSNGKKSSKTRQ